MASTHAADDAPPLSRPRAWAWSLLAGCSLVWLICAAFAFSHIEIGFFWLIAMALSGAMIASIWCALSIYGLVVRDTARPRGKRLPAVGVGVWLATPLLGLFGLWLAWTDADLMLRFRLSETALTTQAEQIIADGASGAAKLDGRAGLFRFQSAALSEDGTVRFFMQSEPVFTETGLIYDPDQRLPKANPSQVERERISQDWVKFVWSD